MSDDREAADPDTTATTEMVLSDADGLPAGVPDFRSHLPGIEPERQITDWGRSERVEGFVDRTVYDFLYRYWFRVAVEGIENVPAQGAALILANHSGAIPADGPMVLKAVREEHPHPRPVHIASGRRLGALPGIGMLVTKLGGVAAHPANLHRLLFDERELVLMFPEGPGAARKPLTERYRLALFDVGCVQAALRARARIVPLAVVGAEEAVPVLARIGPLRGLTRLPHVPLAPALPLPAKFKLRFLEPVRTDGLPNMAWQDQELVRELSADIRALIQENLLEMVAARRSVWLG